MTSKHSNTSITDGRGLGLIYQCNKLGTQPPLNADSGCVALTGTLEHGTPVNPISDLPFNPAHCFINGEWRRATSGRMVALTNPSTGDTICEIAAGAAADIDQAVTAANAAFDSGWGNSTALQRGRILYRLKALVEEHIELLAMLEACDVGKPLTQGRTDARALARYLEFYAGAADKVHGETLPYLDGYTVYTLREPHGVTGHIVPWNYPMQIIGRSVGAALTMGNTCVLKPSEDACLTALMFAELAHTAGLPEGVLNVVPGIGEIAGAALSSHNGISHLSFTGSVAVGTEVQKATASHVVPLTLELGGKSPQLVFDDADLDQALPFLVNAGIQNAGQTCSASSRILVQRGVLDQVVSMMSERYTALRCGPAVDDCDTGPLISSKQLQRVEQLLANDTDLELLASGELAAQADPRGFFLAPRLYLCNDANHCLAQQEIFGPVQLIIPFDDESEAITIANGTDYGLVASIWTASGARQMRLAKKLNAGQVFINNYGAGGGVELPFGGVGKSGYGREKGFEALYGFSRLKTVAAMHG